MENRLVISQKDGYEPRADPESPTDRQTDRVWELGGLGGVRSASRGTAGNATSASRHGIWVSGSISQCPTARNAILCASSRPAQTRQRRDDD